MIKKVIFSAIIAAFLLNSCGNEQKKDNSVSDKSLGIVTSDVMSDDENLLGDMPQYSMTPPGASQKIERAFENAPPMIPHMTTGFLPITKDNNICLSCHMPDKVAKSGAVAIPESHFTDYRPKIKKTGDKYTVDAEEGEVIAQKLDKLSPARFNCSQCHVPQANVTVDIKNNFERVFRNEKLKTGSNLNEVIDEGVK